MNKSPSFQFYPSDYLSDLHVTMMTLEEEGAYIRLMSYCWMEGSIPADIEILKRICKGTNEGVIRVVIERFDKDPNDHRCLVHKRLDLEREKQKEWRGKCSVGGRSGAIKRWGSSASKKIGVVKQHLKKQNGGSVAIQSSSSSSSSIIKTPTPSLMLRIGGWMGRREKTNWSEDEKRKLTKLLKNGEPPEEDLSLLEAYYTAKAEEFDKDYRRRDLKTLLNNWTGEVDRAKKWKAGDNRPQSKPGSSQQLHGRKIEIRRDGGMWFCGLEIKHPEHPCLAAAFDAIEKGQRQDGMTEEEKMESVANLRIAMDILKNKPGAAL